MLFIPYGIHLSFTDPTLNNSSVSNQHYSKMY